MALTHTMAVSLAGKVRSIRFLRAGLIQITLFMRGRCDLAAGRQSWKSSGYRKYGVIPLLRESGYCDIQYKGWFHKSSNRL